MNIEELRKVYEEAYWGVAQSTFDTRDPQLVAVAAVARYSAEKQRGVEPTNGMIARGGSASRFVMGVVEIYRAMQSAAPLWMEEK